MFPACRAEDNDFSLLKGTLIGSGHARDVYNIIDNNDYVLKIAKEEKLKHNENEANFYFTAIINNFTKVIDCIAEVRSISKSGKYLIMERLCVDFSPSLKPVFMIPIEVYDKHKKNFGMTKDKKNIKCLDYGGVSLEKGVSGEVSNFSFPTDELVSQIKGYMNKANGGC